MQKYLSAPSLISYVDNFGDTCIVKNVNYLFFTFATMLTTSKFNLIRKGFILHVEKRALRWSWTLRPIFQNFKKNKIMIYK